MCARSARVCSADLGVMGAPAGAKEGWMRAVRRWQGLAAIGSVLALALGALALIPGAAVASTHACGNHTIVIEQEIEVGKPKTKYKLPIKQIVTHGVSCTSAYKVITDLYSGKPTEGFKCTSGKFKVPKYTIPQQCAKPGKKIQFAGKGG
jgi:hypothetical protein